MNIKNIKDILALGFPDDQTEHLILQEFVKDENVIPKVMQLLNSERDQRKELILDMNEQLSKLHVQFENPEMAGKTKPEQFYTVRKSLTDFYTKYKGYVGHCFANMIKID